MFKKQINVYTIISLFDAGLVPNQISHTFPYPNLYSHEFVADPRKLFHRFHNSQPDSIYSLTRLVLEGFLLSILKVSGLSSPQKVPPGSGAGSPGLRSLVPQPQVLVLKFPS